MRPVDGRGELVSLACPATEFQLFPSHLIRRLPARVPERLHGEVPSVSRDWLSRLSYFLGLILGS